MSVCISSGAKKAFLKVLDVIEVGDSDKKDRLAKISDFVREMPICRTKGVKGKREPSKWQLCLKQELTGKKWDPNRIKEASKKYKKGLCPT